jgi:site-specific DNA-methyltransferase (adenine-specific)/site-specific DNA-methyltransferase (cytosine-N4-specific)
MSLFEVAPTSRGSGSGTLVVGDAARVLEGVGDETFQMVVTSPPYWGLRDYGVDSQIGAEPTVHEYVENLVKLFGQVRRTLRDDGTLWLNVGDSFTSGGRTWRDSDSKLPARGMSYRPATPEGMKPKDLIGVPWMLAFALRDDGWYLRTDIIWHKPNGNPESVKDRPSRKHEFLFLLSKSERYLYNRDAVKVPSDDGRGTKARSSVWSINTFPFPEAHFAVFPPALVEPCVLAGSNEGNLVLDPFFGSGTTGEVCISLGRRFMGIELSDEYADVAVRRLKDRSGYQLQVIRD